MRKARLRELKGCMEGIRTCVFLTLKPVLVHPTTRLQRTSTNRCCSFWFGDGMEASRGREGRWGIKDPKSQIMRE